MMGGSLFLHNSCSFGGGKEVVFFCMVLLEGAFLLDYLHLRNKFTFVIAYPLFAHSFLLQCNASFVQCWIVGSSLLPDSDRLLIWYVTIIVERNPYEELKLTNLGCCHSRRPVTKIRDQEYTSAIQSEFWKERVRDTGLKKEMA